MTFEGVQLQGSLKIMEKLNVSLLNFILFFCFWWYKDICLLFCLGLEGTVTQMVCVKIYEYKVTYFLN